MHAYALCKLAATSFAATAILDSQAPAYLPATCPTGAVLEEAPCLPGSMSRPPTNVNPPYQCCQPLTYSHSATTLDSPWGACVLRLAQIDKHPAIRAIAVD